MWNVLWGVFDASVFPAEVWVGGASQSWRRDTTAETAPSGRDRSSSHPAGRTRCRPPSPRLWPAEEDASWRPDSLASRGWSPTDGPTRQRQSMKSDFRVQSVRNISGKWFIRKSRGFRALRGDGSWADPPGRSWQQHVELSRRRWSWWQTATLPLWSGKTEGNLKDERRHKELPVLSLRQHEETDYRPHTHTHTPESRGNPCVLISVIQCWSSESCSTSSSPP